MVSSYASGWEPMTQPLQKSGSSVHCVCLAWREETCCVGVRQTSRERHSAC